MNLLKLIKARRSIRHYKNKKIKRNIIENILEAARWAPSVHNLQPWKFIVVEDKEKIKYIASIMEKKADELFSGFNIVMRDTAKNIKKTNLLLLAYNTEIMVKKFGRLGSPYTEICSLYDNQSVANAVENMLLYIHDLGLGAVWCGVALFCEKEINDFLKQDNNLSAILSVGYPDKKSAASIRKNISEISEFIK